MDGIKQRESASGRLTFCVGRHRRRLTGRRRRDEFKNKTEESIGGNVTVSDLFLRGDVQVLPAGVEQQVLVDPVSGDVARRPAVHLGMIRQMDLQHLE